MKRFALLFVAVAASAGVVAAQAAESGGSEQYGPVELKLDGVAAYLANGTRAPAKDKECRQMYSGFLGSVVKTTFSTEWGKSWAKSTWSVKGSPDVDFDLHPLGIAGKYAYGNWYRQPFNGKEVYGVSFIAAKKGTEPAKPYSSTVSFIATPDLTCALTNETLKQAAKQLLQEEKAKAGEAK